MLHKYTYLLVLCSIFLDTVSHAQVLTKDTTIKLPAFEVKDNRIPVANPGLKLIQLDSAINPAGNAYTIGEILGRTSSLFLRVNSPNALASPSSRGTAPAHTAVVWNGFNLQSSMNGQSDLNLLYSFLFNKSSFQPGTNSASWGSGAIGGTIFIDSDLEDNRITVGQISGAWNDRKTFFSSGFSTKKIALNFKAFHHEALNNYLFRNNSLSENTLQRQRNASIDMNGVLYQFKIRTGKDHFVHFSQWWQEGNRELPATLLMNNSVAKQYDNILRSSVSWDMRKSILDLRIRAGFFREKIHYSDSAFSLYAKNTAHTFIQEIETGYNPSRFHRIQLGVNNNYNFAMVDAYNASRCYQRRQAIFASWRASFFENRLILLPAIRQEWYDGKKSPVIPSLSGSFQLTKSFKLKSQFASVYRVPTLNDMYWVPGGNPDLKSEEGNSAELSMQYFLERKKIQTYLTGTVFANRIFNRIIWQPGVYWYAVNAGQVNSYGQEINLRLNLTVGKLFIGLNGQAQYLRSGEVAGLRYFENPRYQQIYVPEFSTAHSVEIGKGSFKIFYSGSYTGRRFIAPENDGSIDGFYLANAGISSSFIFRNHLLETSFQLNNLLNASYQVIAWRPMPLCSWQASIVYHFTFSKPN